jgi:hypothetical protein
MIRWLLYRSTAYPAGADSGVLVFAGEPAPAMPRARTKVGGKHGGPLRSSAHFKRKKLPHEELPERMQKNDDIFRITTNMIEVQRNMEGAQATRRANVATNQQRELTLNQEARRLEKLAEDERTDRQWVKDKTLHTMLMQQQVRPRLTRESDSGGGHSRHALPSQVRDSVTVEVEVEVEVVEVALEGVKAMIQ